VRNDRLPLGTLCQFNEFIEGWVVCTVIGTWALTNASGNPGTVETRDRRWRADPQTDESAHGYLLLPSNGTGFIYAHWGDVACGDLVPIS